MSAQEMMTMPILGGFCRTRSKGGRGAEHGWWDRARRSVRRVAPGTPTANPPLPGQPLWAVYGPIEVENESCPTCAAEVR